MEEERKQKLRMSNRRFRAILIPILSVVVVLLVVVTIAMNMFAKTLDQFLGRGKRRVTNVQGTETWDLDYYDENGATPADTKEAAYAVADKVVKEGTILLKNNGVLPLAKQSTVVPFGYRYSSPIYGQMAEGGSGKWQTGEQITPETALKESFKVNNAASSKMKGDPQGTEEAPGTLAAGASGSRLGGNNVLYEYPASVYDDVGKQEGVALVFVGRPGQEGTDKKYDGYADGTPHALALSKNEKETIKAAKRICDKVVLISESAAAMELSPVMSGELECDAILWISQVGTRGFSAVDDILCGDVNPSGRTVDIFASDFTKDPSYQNFGDYSYDNIQAVVVDPYSDGTPSNRHFVEYQEGVYMGYRYYETADVMDGEFTYGVLDGKGGVTTPGAVCYPFGYGLSYTNFRQEIVSFSDNGDDITMQVKVTNDGYRAGKTVVQVYYTSPYTDYDKQNKVEKPVTVLCGFDKTDMIEPHSSQNVTITFAKEDMASYDYSHQNTDGTKGCYVLEAGTYAVELKNNSHDVIESKSVTVAKTTYYEGQNLRDSDKEAQSALDDNGNSLGFPASDPNGQYAPVHNLFQDCSDYMNRQNILSRSDWKGTFPTATPRLKHADDATVAVYADNIENNFDCATDPLYGNVEGSKIYSAEKPTYSGEKTLTVADMRGKGFYDDSWDVLLNQINWDKSGDEIIQDLCECAYNTPEITDIGLPTTSIQDGVNGVKVPSGANYDMEKSSTFGMMPLLSATWNTDILAEVGEALAREALSHKISGLYAPAINLHRSPFGGRVFEYFSEDPYLSGMLTKAEIEGAAKAGMTCYIKHFAGNDQETNRDKLSSTWADEQTLRELYFKAFEIPVKQAKCVIDYIADNNGNHAQKVMRAATGIMSAQMNLGAIPGHANYALQTELLRGEWGFCGTITTDFWLWFTTTGSGGDNLRDLIFRTGADIYLCTGLPAPFNLSVTDKTSPTALNTYRRCVKDLAYTVANSSAMQGAAPGAIIKYSMSPWAGWLLAANIVLYAGVLAGVAIIILRHFDDKKHPEKYLHKQKV